MSIKPTTHTVKSGDTLYSLAKKYGTTVNELKSINGLKSDLIKVGQVLTLVKINPLVSTNPDNKIFQPAPKNLCWALKELAQYENEKGTKDFCEYVIGLSTDIDEGIQLYSKHHWVEDKTQIRPEDIEDTEFLTSFFPEMNYGWAKSDLGIQVQPPTLPLYIDIEWVETGYAAYRRYLGGAFAVYAGFNTVKLLIQKLGGKKGTNFNHPPNKYGFLLGVFIAAKYPNLQSFSDKWCGK